MVAAVRERETLRDDVRVGDIFVDETYSRSLREGHLERLIREWDRGRLGVVYLSLRADGTFACLDGWHRTCACRSVEGDDATLPARVYIDLTVEEEAALFAAFNRDRAQPKPGELFRSRLAAGEKKAHAVHDIVTALGLELSFDGQAGDGKIQAVAAVENIYTKYGGTMLREVLLTLRNTMGANKGAIHSSMIRGLASFLLRYQQTMDPTRLFSVLSTHSPAQVMQVAGSHRSAAPAIDHGTAVGMAILQLYNTGLRSKHLPPWQSKVQTEEAKARARDARRAGLERVKAARNGAR